MAANDKIEVDGYSIEWLNVDYLLIKGPYDHQRRVICGGDFSSLLSALVSIEPLAKGPKP